MKENVRGKAFSGILWGGLEKLSLQVFGFVQGIILARLLSPSDYGLIAMVVIFILISYNFVDAGFGTALIQKKKRKEIDYSTVFVLNLSLSFLISLILFLVAPLISSFYNEPPLIKIVRVYSFIIFLNSLISIQEVRLSVFLEFRKKSVVSIVTTIVSGILSIILAVAGYGVWSLIYPQFLNLLIKVILYWHYQHWIPKLAFSLKSFYDLFGFGSRIFASTLLSTFSGNIYSLVIGKMFSARLLGFYSRADGYAALPAQTITGVLDSVTYPVFSKFQDDDVQLVNSFRRILRVSAYVIFPIMTGLAVLARPLVVVLVTEKWLFCVAYLQVLCFARVWLHVQNLNLNVLKAKGCSNLLLNLEVVRQLAVIFFLVLTASFGIMSICIGSIFAALVSMFANSYFTGKEIQFGVVKQLKEMLPSMFYSLLMGFIIYISTIFISSMLLKVLIGIFIGVVSYLLISIVTKSQDLKYLQMLVCEKLKK